MRFWCGKTDRGHPTSAIVIGERYRIAHTSLVIVKGAWGNAGRHTLGMRTMTRFRQGGIRRALARGSLLPHRTDLCVGRPGWRIWLHRDHGAARLCAAGHEDDCARPQSPGCGNRDSHVPEGWKAVMAKRLAFCDLGLPVFSSRRRCPANGGYLLSGRRGASGPVGRPDGADGVS